MMGRADRSAAMTHTSRILEPPKLIMRFVAGLGFRSMASLTRPQMSVVSGFIGFTQIERYFF